MSLNRVKNFLVIVQRLGIAVVLTLIGSILLLYGICFLIEKDVGNALSCIGAGVATLFAASIDRFELLKIFGLEAKTRDLNRLIDEAQVTIDQLGKVAQTICKPLAVLYCGPNTWGSDPTLAEKGKIALEIKASLKNLGRSDREIRVVLEPWIHGAALDALRYVKENTSQKSNELIENLNVLIEKGEQGDEAREKLRALAEFNLQNHLSSNDLSVSEIAEYLASGPTRAPFLDDGQYADIVRKARKAAEEIKYLNEHLEYGDEKFWEMLSQHYGRR